MRQSDKLRQIGIGARLRQLRDEAGLTTRSVSDSLGISPSSVNRTECGRRAPDREEVSALCALYGATGDTKQEVIDRIGNTAETTAWLTTGYAPDQLSSLMVLEREAVSITILQVSLVPGLAQTTDYARAVLASYFVEEDVERAVGIRLGRQAMLSRPKPPDVVLLIEEGALRRTLGDARMMRDQLEQLTMLQRRDNVRVRVIPCHAKGTPANEAPFSLYRLGDGGTYAFVEAHSLGAFLTDPGEIKPFVEVSRKTSACALDEESSNALIKEIAEGLTDE